MSEDQHNPIPELTKKEEEDRDGIFGWFYRWYDRYDTWSGRWDWLMGFIKANTAATVATTGSSEVAAAAGAAGSADASGSAVTSAVPSTSAVALVSAGSSATATAPAGCSDACGVTEAFASVSGAVPPCCSSVNVVVTPGVGFAPENHERPGHRSGRDRKGWVGPW